jgi:acetylornithine deacetylase/succinyl-diaminopimelate desuccinylase-like protein
MPPAATPDADAVGRIVDDAIAIAGIEAPTFAERARGEAVLDRLLALHLDAAFDEAGSVVARIGEEGPALAVCAHLDTVFPAGTDLRVRRDGDRLIGPGIGDNALGVAALLHVARVLALAPPPKPVLLAFTVGEEGLGDLRGVSALLDREEVRALIAVEGHGVDTLAVGGIASLRFRVAATGPGGHSWTDRGAPSAVHALVEAAARVLPVADPVAINIGTIHGGTAVNAIAEHAELLIDLRHHDAAEVHAAGSRVRAALAASLPEGIALEVDEVGNRPGGVNRQGEPLVERAREARAAVGLPVADEHLASTDANAALARGIPAVALGMTRGDNAHRVDEWILVPPIAQGVGALVELVATAP